MTITDEKFLEALDKYRDSDKINPTTEEGGACLYNGPNGTHCIIGQTLIDLGVSAEDLGTFEMVGAVSVLDHFAECSDPVKIYASCVQSSADVGDTWAEALRRCASRRPA